MSNLVRGMIIGLAIGYLTAPKEGKKTREELASTKNDLKDFWDDAKVRLKATSMTEATDGHFGHK